MKKIISLLCALTLLFGVVLSTTSCFSLSSILDSITSEEEGGGTDVPGLPEEEEKTPDIVGGDDEKNNADTGSESDFLPDRDESQDAAESLTGPNRTLLSTVSIIANFTVSTGGIYGGATSPDKMAGSGVVYKLDKESGDAYIITNFHVVYNVNSVTASGISDDIQIYLYGQEYSNYAISATYVGGSLNYDIAVLKVEGSDVIKNSPVLAADIGDSDSVRVFDDVFVVGNPEAYGISVTEGIVSVESESLAMTGADGKTSVTFRVMRISAAVNNGNSGGGLYSESGELIGIINAKRQGSDIDNIGYAIPVNLAVALVENIIYHCDGYLKTSVYKCLLGVTIAPAATGVVIDPDTGDIITVDIVTVQSVEATGVVAGKILVGDVINSVTVDGVKYEVTRNHHLVDNMLHARVGSTVVLNVTRGTATLDVSVVVPESAQSAIR